MSNKKTRRSSSKQPAKGTKKVVAGAAATDRARKAAIAEIQNRLEAKPAKPGKDVVKKVAGSSHKKPSGLDAAAKVLSTAKEPMRCQAIVSESIKRGLWKSDGKTPAATIHAAMIREIAAKGKDARFRKVGRGLFAATKGA